jgi:mannose/fructose/N-acetylgalactosamine-specific phosphotransferase system component IIC
MNWPALVLLGGAVGLDGTSFPQVMISRPIVAGALAGLIGGAPVEGAVVGAVLEIFHLAILPIGAAKYPEAGTATVAAVVAYLAAPAPARGGAALLLAVVFALLWERLTGASVVRFRRAVEHILFAGGRAALSARGIEARHLLAVLLDFARGAAVCTLGAIIGALALRLLAPFWGLPNDVTRGALAIAGSAILAGALTVFGGWTEQRRTFLLGALCGVALLFLA